MPKIKTHKTTAKRFKVSGSNRLVGRKMSVAHRARFKSKRAKRQKGLTVVVETAVAKKLKTLLKG
ncbi:MAG: bL35 family ribosomal protein [Patescibacteria group bacterium]